MDKTIAEQTNQVDFANLELLAQQVVEGFITGLHKSPFHGFSVEFAEHRSYNPGESVKNIDWKLFARTDKLFVKRFEEETNLRCQLVLDGSSSMYYPEKGLNKFQFSVYAAASLIYLLKKQRDAFGLSLFSETIDFQTPAKSTTAHQQFLFATLQKQLDQKPKNKTTKIAKNLHEIAENIHKRSMVVIFSDFMENVMDSNNIDALFSALQHLKHNKHEIILFNVSDHAHELNFNFENRPYHFVDPETGAEIKLHPQQIKTQYLDHVKQLKKALETKCGQYKIDFIDADTAAGFNPILKAWLIKRNKMI